MCHVVTHVYGGMTEEKGPPVFEYGNGATLIDVRTCIIDIRTQWVLFRHLGF